MIEDLPVLRTIDQLLEQATMLAIRCERDQPADEVANMLEEGMSIMLELRVPRMPEDPHELQAMLERTEGQETLSSEDVMRSLETSALAFRLYMDRFRGDIAREHWTGAGSALLPSGTSGAPRWSGPSVNNRIFLGDSGSGTTTLRRRGETVSCTSPIGGLSILGAVMRAHVQWESIWKR